MQIALSAVLALAPCLTAQTTTVVPAKYATTPAGAYTGYPFGLSGPSRFQYLYASTELAIPPVIVIKQLAIRGEPTLTAPAKSGVDLEIGLTTTPIDPALVSTTFASNLGTDYKLAFTRKTLNLPAQPGGSPTAPFVTVFVPDVPFVYFQVNGHFLVDYLIYSQPPGPYSHETNFTTVAPGIVPNGSSCGGLTQSVTGGVWSTLSATLGFTVSGVPSGGKALHLLGSMLWPAPLPLPLGGCPLYQDLIFTSPMLVFGSGASISYPLLSTFKGLTVYGQGLAVDATFTAITASQSHKVTIGGYEPYTRIYHLSSVTSATGTLQFGVGIVTQLSY